jgi:hypothetical protein
MKPRNEFGNRLDDIRRTPPELVTEVARLVGVERFTLDVAASPGIQVAGVDSYYSLEEGRDAFALPWNGHVWCNPPYSDIGRWVERVWNQTFRRDLGPRPASVTMLIPANKTEQAWWQRHVEPARVEGTLSVHFLPGRRRFLMPDGSPIYARNRDGSVKRNGRGEPVIGSPSFGLCVLHWR